MGTAKKYLSAVLLLCMFLSAATVLFSVCRMNCRAYLVLRETLRNQSFGEEAEE